MMPPSRLERLSRDLPATVREQIVFPSLKFVRTANGVKHILTRLQP
jgi:hypothetical protein